MLLFKKKFLPAILAGEKTQTIRLWRRRQLRAGQASYIPGAGYIRILAVEPTELDALTDADAVPDGFVSAVALRTEIEQLYPLPWSSGTSLYRVCFRRMTEDEVEQHRRERQSKRNISR